MARFIINEGSTYERVVEGASDYAEDKSLVIFRDDDGNQVFAIPTKAVHSIARKAD